MKRIAFITNGFTGSILPLTNELLKKNYIVDVFYMIYHSQNQHEFEALEILGDKKYGYGINDIPNIRLRGVEWIENQQNFHFYLICNFGNASKKNRMLRFVSSMLQTIVLRRIVCKIKHTKYFAVNVVGHDSLMVDLSICLRGKNLFHICHEVYLHSDSRKPMLESVAKLIKKNIPIIVPSQHLKKYILDIVPNYPIRAIPFGKFIGYKSFNTNFEIAGLPEKYLLFLGNVLPYKGLDALVESYHFLKQNNKTVKIVIAGNGHSTILNSIKPNKDFCIINRWITNDELVTLINKCIAVVCPYLSASQSGIPVTAYVFNKPVIVTNVGAMAEYVQENMSGYIVPFDNIQQLAEKMYDICKNESSTITEEHMAKIENELNIGWDSIAQKYINLIENKER